MNGDALLLAVMSGVSFMAAYFWGWRKGYEKRDDEIRHRDLADPRPATVTMDGVDYTVGADYATETDMVDFIFERSTGFRFDFPEERRDS